MLLKQWCVIFNDGSGKTVLGYSKDHVRKNFLNVRSVFRMGIKHSDPNDKYEQEGIRGK